LRQANAQPRVGSDEDTAQAKTGELGKYGAGK